MTISVDIADRLYDYTDEEQATIAVADYQSELGLDDQAIITIWADETDSRRAALEKRIFDAVDANGSAKRAQTAVPSGIYLTVEHEITQTQIA